MIRISTPRIKLRGCQDATRTGTGTIVVDMERKVGAPGGAVIRFAPVMDIVEPTGRVRHLNHGQEEAYQEEGYGN